MIVKMKKLRDNVILPTKNNENDAGFDCYVNGFLRWNDLNNKFIHYDDDMNSLLVLQGNIIGCKLGFSMEIPKGYYMQLVPKSGLALKHGITVVNSPGTIDSGYRGEGIAIITNLSRISYEVKLGDKIAQLILRKEIKTELVESNVLEDSKRGKKGFGSSGR